MREKDELFWNTELKYLYWMDKLHNMRECWMNSVLPLIVYANYTQYRSSGGGGEDGREAKSIFCMENIICFEP